MLQQWSGLLGMLKIAGKVRMARKVRIAGKVRMARKVRSAGKVRMQDYIE